MLFTSYIRTSNAAKKRRLSAYEFYDQSAWPIAEMMRVKQESWITPWIGDKDFLQSFKSKRDKQHYSAAFELNLYAVLSKSGFTLIKHPPTGTLQKPDFLLSAPGVNFDFYMELTLAGNSYEALEEKNRKDAVEEIIDDIEYYPYWINIHFEEISEQSISKKALLKFIDIIKDKSEGIDNHIIAHTRYLFENNGWKLEISLIRKTTGTIKRSLGMIGDNAKTIKSDKPILNSLKDKIPGQYGIPDKPYVISLNTSDLFTDENSFAEALFGQHVAGRIDFNFPTNGFFMNGGQPNNTSVSAVIIFRNFDTFTMDRTQVAVWHNPFAKNPITEDIFPFVEYRYTHSASFLTRSIKPVHKSLLEILEINQALYIKGKDVDC